MSEAIGQMPDTNLLVRYFTGVPTDQYEQAAALNDSEISLRLSVTAILETAHVLRRISQIPREEVADALTDLLRRQNLEVCELPRQRVIDALALCRPSGRVSFGDALIWARAAEENAAVVIFDRRFPREEITVRLL